MAYFLFTKAILEGKPIKVFNRGNMHRDFTYIDDVVEGSVRIVDKVPEPFQGFDSADPDPATSWAPYRIYNLGNRRPVNLMNFIEAIETCLDKQAEKIFLPMQAGDVIATSADVSELERTIGFSPKTSVADGVRRFVDWYRSYYCV
jgi:UDP-glucuronate 4-epimerase